MMEGMRQSLFEEKVIATPETGLELPKHVDVSEVMRDKNAFFVHMIQVTDQVDVSENNESGIDTTKLSVIDKLDMLYGVSPTVSASTLRPKTNDGTFYGGFGVIFSHGEIESASPGDIGSTATSLTTRRVNSIMNEPEDIDRAIDRDFPTPSKSYNEVVLKNPEVGGGFMKLDSIQDRVRYEDEEQEHYDGEKVITKIGIADFSNPVDRRGNPTGQNFDVPFSTLKEMYDRGKTFFMDEANQMYIIRTIDESTRKVEFVASPITPKDFSFYYGKDHINKYHKQEMRDRLDKSLKQKGIALH
jgi:hypothetical protein